MRKTPNAGFSLHIAECTHTPGLTHTLAHTHRKKKEKMSYEFLRVVQ